MAQAQAERDSVLGMICVSIAIIFFVAGIMFGSWNTARSKDQTIDYLATETRRLQNPTEIVNKTVEDWLLPMPKKFANRERLLLNIKSPLNTSIISSCQKSTNFETGANSYDIWIETNVHPKNAVLLSEVIKSMNHMQDNDTYIIHCGSFHRNEWDVQSLYTIWSKGYHRFEGEKPEPKWKCVVEKDFGTKEVPAPTKKDAK